MRPQDHELHPAAVQQQLDCGGHRRYAFHWNEDPVPPRLLIHRRRQHQQDALRHGWDGLVAGTDGSIDVRTERMGAGYVLGADPEPVMTFCARVGGPLASARAEAASLLQLMRDVRQRCSHHVHVHSDLLVFVDCLSILLIFVDCSRHSEEMERLGPFPRPMAVIRPLL